MKSSIIVLIIVLTLLIFLVYSLKPPSQTEDFGQLTGALYPYRKQLSQCLDDCAREDPAKRLTGPNLFCWMGCQSKFTNMSKNGIPPEEADKPTIIDRCRTQCQNSLGPTDNCTNDRLMVNKCIGNCACKHQVVDKCWNDCQYTTNRDKCMKDCVDIGTVRCNQFSWTWRLP